MSIVKKFVEAIPTLSIIVISIIIALGIAGFVLSILSSPYALYIAVVLLIMAGIFWVVSIVAATVKASRINQKYPELCKKIGISNPKATEIQNTVSLPIALWALLATVVGVFTAILFGMFQIPDFLSTVQNFIHDFKSKCPWW